MNLFDKITSNIKINNLASNKSQLFTGFPLLNCNMIIVIINNNNNKTLIDDDIIMINDKDEDEEYNLKSLYGKNSFIIYKFGYNFFNNELNEKIIFMSPLNNSNYSANIYTTLISYKHIEMNDNKQMKINDNKQIKINDNKQIVLSLFNKLFGKKFDHLNIQKIIKTNYYHFFIQKNMIENICDYHGKKFNNNDEIELYINLIKTDIKFNFLILFVIKLKNKISQNEIFKLYGYIWDNLENFCPTIENINLYYGIEFLTTTLTNINFNNAIITWFNFIDFSNDLVYLFNICSNFYKFTDQDLNSQSVNKKVIINKYINYSEFKNKLIMYKIYFE